MPIGLYAPAENSTTPLLLRSPAGDGLPWGSNAAHRRQAELASVPTRDDLLIVTTVRLVPLATLKIRLMGKDLGAEGSSSTARVASRHSIKLLNLAGRSGSLMSNSSKGHTFRLLHQHSMDSTMTVSCEDIG